jgi:hypothetical protein
VISTGAVAGMPTALLVELNASPRPLFPGLAIEKGRSIRVRLPEAFRVASPFPLLRLNDGGCSAPIAILPRCNSVDLLQDGLTRRVSPYAYDVALEGTHTLVFTAREDIPARSGVKQIHLLLPGFRNPAPGRYAVEVTTDIGSSGSHTETVEVQIVSAATPTAAAMNLSENPFSEFLERPARTFDVLLWGAQGEALEGVTLERDPRDPTRNSYLLMKSGDALGTVRVETPDPQASTDLVAEASVGTSAPVSGVPVGYMRFGFGTTNFAGEYRVLISLFGGSTAEIFVHQN